MSINQKGKVGCVFCGAILLSMIHLTFSAWAGDDVPASRSHPSSDTIVIEDVPMFICLGFDDNGVADVENNGGATWIRNFLKDKKNPDGSGMRATFYFTAKYCREDVYEDKLNVRKVWKQLHADGHEVGNHSTVHLMEWDDVNQRAINFDGKSYTKEEWLEKEILPCQQWLLGDELGFQKHEIMGWRSPRLEWSPGLFYALEEEGFLYDCSVESSSDNDGTNEFWPFTLNNGHPEIADIPKIAGLWEMPAYRFLIPIGLRSKTNDQFSMTGLDYNVWAKRDWGGYELTGPEFTEILKYTLDQRMAGNRAPMLIGLHSDIYTDLHGKNNEYSGTQNARERQLAIEDFIEYAVSTYPDAVRVLPTVEVIRWMNDPQPIE